MGFVMATIPGVKPIPPIVEYRYYRWRWMAKLCAALDSCAPLPGIIVITQYLGRVIWRNGK